MLLEYFFVDGILAGCNAGRLGTRQEMTVYAVWRQHEAGTLAGLSFMAVRVRAKREGTVRISGGSLSAMCVRKLCQGFNPRAEI